MRIEVKEMHATPLRSGATRSFFCFAVAVVLGAADPSIMAQAGSIQQEQDAKNQPLEIEKISVAKLSTDKDSMVFLPDLTAGHLLDTRVNVVDGDTMSYLATIPTGMVGLFTVNAVHDEVYVATTYLSRGTRGERTDIVEIYDTKTLELQADIVISPKRAQAVPYAPYLKTSSDGNILFVQNITPASSVTVIDVKERKILSEVETSGCAGIYPAPTSLRFSTLCGDGSLITISLNNGGQESSRSRSERIFPPIEDPLFIASAATNDGVIFMSYAGSVHEVDLTESTAKLKGVWSMLSDSDKESGWKPGGFELIAYHRNSRELFVTMHANGKEGSHKNPADEIWRVSVMNRKVSERIPGHSAVSLGVTQTDNPVLFALNGNTGALAKLKIGKTTHQVDMMDAPFVHGPTTLIMP